MIGTIVKEFGRRPGNARNSEGAFYSMDDGKIAFVFSKYSDNAGDNACCDLAICFSYDSGKSFSDDHVILTAKECNAINIMSVSLLKMNDSQIGLFYLKKTADGQCRMFLRKTNDFVNFSQEIQCINDDGYFVVNNDRIVRLTCGRIIIPSAFTPINGKSSGENPAVARFYCSDDDGMTWKLLSQVHRPYEIMQTGLQEPAIIQLNDKIVAFFRNNLGRQYVSYSFDNCLNWTIPVPSRFTSPESPISVKKLSNGKLLAIYNPVPTSIEHTQVENGIWTGGRNPLCISICENNFDDELKSIIIENDKSRGFCYTSIFETEKGILLAYCAGGKEDWLCLARVRLRYIDKKEL